MIKTLRQTRDEKLAWIVTEALTTNETFFFRDQIPFDNMSEHVMPAFAAARPAGAKIRIWCAACSSGQEPYSLAMVFDENPQLLGGRPYEIVATDICNKVLEKAKTGLYSQFEVQRGLPVTRLVKYFQKAGDMWQISPVLKQHIRFQRFNLMESFVGLGKFDVVFCRNVLIYFDQQQKTDILNRIAGQMAGDGYLMLGASESVIGCTDRYRLVNGRRGLFERAEAKGDRRAA